MSKFFALLFAVIGFLLLGIGLTSIREHPSMLTLAIAGAAITYIAYFVDRRREKSAAEQRDKETKLRIEALAKAPWESGKFLEVNAGRSHVFIASLILTASVSFAFFLVFETEIRWGMLAGSVLFSAFVLFALIRSFHRIGKPAVVLNIKGFQTPLHGTIPWQEVGGISLQKITIRGATTITLCFQVENYAKAVVRVHWTEWLLSYFGLGALKRKVIVILLDGATEDPETVAAIARLLWQQSTGMNHEWNPMLSKEINQAARRAHEFMDRCKDPKASVEDILRDPGKALKEAEQFRQDMDTVNSERRRINRNAYWLAAISLLGIVTSLLWPLVRSHI